MEKEYQDISEEELKAILERHKEWLESEGESGAKAYLHRADLGGADLLGAHLSGARLNDADLRKAYLHRADLHAVDLLGADLTWTNLTGAEVNEAAQGLKGARVGVNGIWTEGRDTAALMPLTPPGDSMQGANAEAVVESLGHARKLHTFSFVLVLLGLVIIYLDLGEVQVPFFSELVVPAEKFALLAMAFSAGFLALVGTFMDDALAGARYLQTRRDAQTVGNFPWALSRYAGRRSKALTETWFTRVARKARTVQSYTARSAMAFHPMAYLLLWDWGGSTPWYWSGSVPWYYWALGLLLALSTRIFLISRQFQRPIVFDGPTERERKSDLEKLTLTVKSLDDKLGTLLDERNAGQKDSTS